MNGAVSIPITDITLPSILSPKDKDKRTASYNYVDLAIVTQYYRQL